MLIQWHRLMILLFLLSSSETESRWILEAQLQHYINPTSRDDNGDCCNSTSITSPSPSQCPSPCSNKFTFRLHQSHVLNHTYGTYNTGLVTGGDNLTFTDGEPIGENNISNPLIFNGTQWPNNDQLYFVTFIIYKTTDGVIDFVSTLEKSIRSIFNGWSHNITFRGTASNNVSLQVWFNMRCDQHYYGHQCGTFCQSRDDNTGHYTCDSDGNRVCNTGYHMIESNCTTPICDPVCNSSNQQCVSPNSCVCRDGWTGITCDHDTTDNTTNSTNTDTTNNTTNSTNSTNTDTTNTNTINTDTINTDPTITSITNTINTDTTITSITITSITNTINTDTTNSTNTDTTNTNTINTSTTNTVNTTNTSNTNTVNGNSTTIAILGAVAALLVITTISITFLTLFTVCKRKNSRTKKGQDTAVANNTAEEPRTHLATNNHQQESSGDDLKRLFDSPIYAEPLKQETNTPSSNTRVPISQYSLVTDANELDEVLPCYPGASYLELLKGSDNGAYSKPFRSEPTRAVEMSSEMPEIDVVEYADI